MQNIIPVFGLDFMYTYEIIQNFKLYFINIYIEWEVLKVGLFIIFWIFLIMRTANLHDPY